MRSSAKFRFAFSLLLAAVLTAPAGAAAIQEGERMDPAPGEEDLFDCERDALAGHFEAAGLDALIDCVEELKGSLAEAGPSEVARWRAALAGAEGALRTRGDQILEAIATKEKLLLNPATGDEERTKLFEEIQELQKEITKIKAVVTFSDKKLFVNFADYDDYFFRFNTGYEFVSIDKLFDEGTPRVGFLVNLQLGGHKLTDTDDGWSWGRYGARLGFSAILNSSAEQQVSVPDETGSGEGDGEGDDEPPQDGMGSMDDENADVKQTLDFELQLFKPFHRTVPLTPNDLRSYFGLLLTAGGLKADEADTVDERFYGGFRFAINPELYWDFLYGKTGSLRSRRLEVRGQVPIRLFANGDRLYLGAIGNFGIDGEKDEIKDAAGMVLRPAEDDVIRVYLSWNADLAQLFGGSKQGQR